MFRFLFWCVSPVEEKLIFRRLVSFSTGTCHCFNLPQFVHMHVSAQISFAKEYLDLNKQNKNKKQTNKQKTNKQTKSENNS